MASVTQVAPDPTLAPYSTTGVTGTPVGGFGLNLSDCNLYRWSLSIQNGQTFASGLTGIVEYAIAPTRTQQAYGGSTDGTLAGSCRVSALSNGTFTFGASTTVACDLLVWTRV